MTFTGPSASFLMRLLENLSLCTWPTRAAQVIFPRVNISLDGRGDRLGGGTESSILGGAVWGLEIREGGEAQDGPGQSWIFCGRCYDLAGDSTLHGIPILEMRKLRLEG